jgi:hypothetical protein
MAIAGAGWDMRLSVFEAEARLEQIRTSWGKRFKNKKAISLDTVYDA